MGERHATIERFGTTTICALSGEIDMAVIGESEHRVQSAVSDAEVVIVDLRAVAFIDSSGLRFLVRLQEATTDRGARFGLIHVSPAALRLLDVTGLEDAFTIHDSVADALATGPSSNTKG